MPGIATTEVTPATAKYKQGITSNDFIAELIAGRARRVAWRVLYYYRAVAERDFITTVVQARFIELVLPEFVFGFEQVNLGVGIV